MDDENKLTEIHLNFKQDVMNLFNLIARVHDLAQDLYFSSTNSELYRSDDGKQMFKNLAYQFGVVTCHNNDLRVVISELLGHLTPDLTKKFVERLKCLEEDFAKRTK